MEGRDDVGAVFAALADPTRRHVVGYLALHDTVTASELALQLPVTRQAVAKHLAALADVGLVAPTRVGRETRYHLTGEPLGDAAEWLTALGARWDERLARLALRAAGDAS